MRTVRELLTGLTYTCDQGTIDQEITDLIYDSRKEFREGSMFVCLTGMVYDAHVYITQAIEKGAKVLVVEKGVQAYKGVTIIRVSNTRYALAMISAAYFDYPARKLTIIGITGTKGKTTTAWMTKALLEKAGYQTGIIGTIGACYQNRMIKTKNSTPESYELHFYLTKCIKQAVPM